MIKQNQTFSSFSVTDLQKAKQFYSEVLGMEVSESEYTLDLHIGGDKKVMVYPKENHTPAMDILEILTPIPVMLTPVWFWLSEIDGLTILPLFSKTFSF